MRQLPSTMKAAMFYGPNDLRVERVPVPEAGPNDVALHVDMCGICGTDVHSPWSFPAPNLPLIPGHEFSGHVVAVGGSVDHVKTGDYVTADINLACGHCYFCRRQQKLFCEQIRQIGVHTHGALAEFVKAPASAIYQVPDELSPQQSAYIEPLACSAWPGAGRNPAGKQRRHHRGRAHGPGPSPARQAQRRHRSSSPR